MDHFAKKDAKGEFQRGKLTFDIVEREFLLDFLAEYKIYKEHLLTLQDVKTEDPVYLSQIQHQIKKAKEIQSLLLNPQEWE